MTIFAYNINIIKECPVTLFEPVFGVVSTIANMSLYGVIQGQFSPWIMILCCRCPWWNHTQHEPAFLSPKLSWRFQARISGNVWLLGSAHALMCFDMSLRCHTTFSVWYNSSGSDETGITEDCFTLNALCMRVNYFFIPWYHNYIYIPP